MRKRVLSIFLISQLFVGVLPTEADAQDAFESTSATGSQTNVVGVFTSTSDYEGIALNMSPKHRKPQSASEFLEAARDFDSIVVEGYSKKSELIEKAIELLHASQDRELLQGAYHQLAMCWRRDQWKKPNAAFLLSQSIEDMEAANYENFLRFGNVHFDLGMLEFERHSFLSAERQFEEAMKCYSQMTAARGAEIPDVKFMLATVQSIQQKRDAALSSFGDAAKAYAALGDRYNLKRLKCLYSLAVLTFQAKQFDKSRAAFKECLQMCDHLDDLTETFKSRLCFEAALADFLRSDFSSCRTNAKRGLDLIAVDPTADVHKDAFRSTYDRYYPNSFAPLIRTSDYSENATTGDEQLPSKDLAQAKSSVIAQMPRCLDLGTTQALWKDDSGKIEPELPYGFPEAPDQVNNTKSADAESLDGLPPYWRTFKRKLRDNLPTKKLNLLDWLYQRHEPNTTDFILSLAPYTPESLLRLYALSLSKTEGPEAASKVDLIADRTFSGRNSAYLSAAFSDEVPSTLFARSYEKYVSDLVSLLYSPYFQPDQSKRSDVDVTLEIASNGSLLMSKVVAVKQSDKESMEDLLKLVSPLYSVPSKSPSPYRVSLHITNKALKNFTSLSQCAEYGGANVAVSKPSLIELALLRGDEKLADQVFEEMSNEEKSNKFTSRVLARFGDLSHSRNPELAVKWYRRAFLRLLSFTDFRKNEDERKQVLEKIDSIVRKKKDFQDSYKFRRHLAESAESAGDLWSAIAEYQIAYELGIAQGIDPQEPATNLKLGELFYSVGRYDDALTCLQRSRSGDFPRIDFLIAKCYEAKNDLDSARSYYVSALSKDPENYNIVFKLLTLARKGVRESEDSGLKAQRLLELAEVYNFIGENEQAADLVASASSCSPYYAPAYIMFDYLPKLKKKAEAFRLMKVAISYAKQLKHEEAIRYAHVAAECDPTNGRVLIDLGQFYAGAANYDKAEEIFTRCSDMKTGVALILYGAECQSRRRGQEWISRVADWNEAARRFVNKDFEGARSIYETISRDPVAMKDTSYWLAVTSNFLGHEEAARSSYQKFLNDPRSNEYLRKLAANDLQTLNKKGSDSECSRLFNNYLSQTDYIKARDILRDSDDCLSAHLLSKRAFLDEPSAALASVIAKNCSPGTTESVKWYKMALALEPDNRDFRQDLKEAESWCANSIISKIYEGPDCFRQGNRQFEKAVEIAPSSGDVLWNYAKYLREHEKYSKAIKYARLGAKYNAEAKEEGARGEIDVKENELLEFIEGCKQRTRQGGSAYAFGFGGPGIELPKLKEIDRSYWGEAIPRRESSVGFSHYYSLPSLVFELFPDVADYTKFAHQLEHKLASISLPPSKPVNITIELEGLIRRDGSIKFDASFDSLEERLLKDISEVEFPKLPEGAPMMIPVKLVLNSGPGIKPDIKLQKLSSAIDFKVPETKNQAASEKAVDFVPYMEELQNELKSAWKPPRGLKTSKATVLFNIRSDGTVIDVGIKQSSGIALFDKAALDAIDNAKLSPLPIGAPPKVSIEFTFECNVTNFVNELGVPSAQPSALSEGGMKEDVSKIPGAQTKQSGIASGPILMVEKRSKKRAEEEQESADLYKVAELGKSYDPSIYLIRGLNVLPPPNFPPLPNGLDLPVNLFDSSTEENDSEAMFNDPEQPLPKTHRSREATEHNNLGVLFGAAGYWNEAIKEHQSAILIEPLNPAWRVNLSAAYMEFGKKLGAGSDAEMMFRKALEVDPANWAAEHQLVVCLSKTGVVPDSTSVIEKTADLAFSVQDYGSELVERRRLRRLTGQPLSMFSLGVSLLRLGKVQESFQNLFDASTSNDWSSENRKERSECLTLLGKILEQLSIVAFENKGESLGLARLKAAGVQFRRAVILDPENHEALTGLLSVAAKSVSINPSTDNRITLAAAYELIGDFENANKQYAQCPRQAESGF